MGKHIASIRHHDGPNKRAKLKRDVHIRGGLKGRRQLEVRLSDLVSWDRAEGARNAQLITIAGSDCISSITTPEAVLPGLPGELASFRSVLERNSFSNPGARRQDEHEANHCRG